ncbi:transmembrane protein 181 [Helicoverpa zea]|uniref:transmembrane protein 181 n=1 Tax=Helicoverpa zea TaxID=7113 RepID=UPI001F55D8F3|nr:transmembrane protein 181 [Helicoverpa zea]XP_049694639.1 transmembrane protein 181 [Helicoverpa armigera]
MDTANVGYSYHLPTGGWNYKIRNTLSQFSDLFSEFNKYIAPAYHHDRCERSVQMRIYSMHKGEFVMVFIAFFACFGLGVFIGLAGPSPTMTTSIPASSVLTNASSIYQGPFHLHSKALGLRAQQLWLMAEILTNNDDEEIFDKSFQVSISIEGVLADHTTEDILSEADAPNRTQHLKCKKRVCDEVMILHILWLDYTHYVFNVNFFGLKEFHHRYFIRDIIFYFKTYNPAFTQMETWFRFIFVMTSFFMTFWFAYMMRKYPMTDWSIEQRWIYILLPLLLTFNDPIYPLRFFPGAIMAPLIGNFFQTIFLGAVMISWLVQYHGLRQNDRGIVSFYLFKYVVVIMCGIPAIVLGNWQKFNSYLDPTFNYMMDPDYPLVKLWFFCAITIYFLYLLILIIKAYSDLRNMPFFDIRLRCLSIVVGTVTSIITILALQGWGPAALQDHWACQPKVHFDTSAPFMALYGLFNFYIYILAYLFSPGGGNIHETAITKDNPAFSMINDSDEEVIYGSDEESRRPLNSHHRITTDEDL